MLFIFGLALRAVEHNAIVDAGVREEALESVIIFVQDRIEFVIVAACTGDRDAHESIAHGVGDVVQHLLTAQSYVRGVVLVGKVAVKG